MAALGGMPVAHALNLPFVPEDERRALEPFLPVAERLGRLAMALAEGPVTRIEIATAGRLASTGSRLLTSAALRGAFGAAHESLNDVNALSIAAELGVEVAEQHRSGASDYTNLLAVTVRDPDERTVVGTVLGADHRALARPRPRPAARDRARRPPAPAAQRRRPRHGRSRRHAARRRRASTSPT